jgi:hypothetical protein
MKTMKNTMQNSAETGLSGATYSPQQLAANYIEKKEEATRANAELKEAKRQLEVARENGKLQETWNKRSKAFIMPGGLRIRETTRTTYTYNCYSDKLRKLMDKEQEDGTATPTISTSFSYTIVED